MASRLVLTGIYGAFKGKKFYIQEGESIVLGRSHSCDIVLESGTFLEASEADTEHITKHFQTISRKHLRITFHNEVKVELEDLSANGTFLDGERVERIFLADITTESHTILLGSREKFLLEWEPIS